MEAHQELLREENFWSFRNIAILVLNFVEDKVIEKVKDSVICSYCQKRNRDYSTKAN